MVLPERIYRAARDGDRDTVIAYLNAPAEAGGLPDVNEQSATGGTILMAAVCQIDFAARLALRKLYARVLYRDPDATLDDLREVVATLEELERIARRVLGGEPPRTMRIDVDLRDARAALAARETQPSASA